MKTHTDTDERPEKERADDYWKSVAELEAEDRAMEEYYESKHNTKE